MNCSMDKGGEKRRKRELGKVEGRAFIRTSSHRCAWGIEKDV